MGGLTPLLSLEGAYAAMTRYVGVMMGTTASLEFVVVGIAGSPRERAEVSSLLRRKRGLTRQLAPLA